MYPSLAYSHKVQLFLQQHRLQERSQIQLNTDTGETYQGMIISPFAEDESPTLVLQNHEGFVYSIPLHRIESIEEMGYHPSHATTSFSHRQTNQKPHLLCLLCTQESNARQWETQPESLPRNFQQLPTMPLPAETPESAFYAWFNELQALLRTQTQPQTRGVIIQLPSSLHPTLPALLALHIPHPPAPIVCLSESQPFSFVDIASAFCLQSDIAEVVTQHLPSPQYPHVHYHRSLAPPCWSLLPHSPHLSSNSTGPLASWQGHQLRWSRLDATPQTLRQPWCFLPISPPQIAQQTLAPWTSNAWLASLKKSPPQALVIRSEWPGPWPQSTLSQLHELAQHGVWTLVASSLPHEWSMTAQGVDTLASWDLFAFPKIHPSFLHLRLASEWSRYPSPKQLLRMWRQHPPTPNHLPFPPNHPSHSSP